ncbi:MAG: hypothetical protein WBF06_16075 [Candidatus Acidiferrales bacterium]
MIRIVRIHGIAEVERIDIRSGLQRELREAARSASDFEDFFTLQPGRPLGRGDKTVAAKIILHDLIDLKPLETLPLKSKRRRIIFRRHKSRHAAKNRKALGAPGALQLTSHNISGRRILLDNFCYGERALARRTVQKIERPSLHLFFHHERADPERILIERAGDASFGEPLMTVGLNQDADAFMRGRVHSL